MTGVSETRAARPDEAEAVLETLCAAFELNLDAARPIFYGDPYYDLSHKRILTLPGLGVVSCLTVVPLSVRVGGVPIPAGGVAGVATLPNFQRQGHAAALLAATVPVLWDELHYPISLLHAVSAPFYRRFGWETAASGVRWSAVPASLPVSAESAFVRPATAEDWPMIDRLYTECTQADTGACVRDSRRLALVRMPVPGRETYVYENASGLSGYSIWERGQTLEVLEMQGRTAEARQGLIGFLARQPDPAVEGLASPPFLADFGLSAAGTETEPGVMLRVTALAAALSAVHKTLYAPVLAEARAALTIHAADLLCPRNARPLRLTPEGILPGAASDPHWLRADIGTLGPLYFGHTRPSDLYRAGLLECDSPQTLSLASRLFPLRAPFIAPLDQS